MSGRVGCGFTCDVLCVRSRLSRIQVVDEVGRHITFRYEGVLPLSDQELLKLLDILVNNADLIEVIQPITHTRRKTCPAVAGSTGMSHIIVSLYNSS